MELPLLRKILEAMLFAVSHPISLNDVLEIFDRVALEGTAIDRDAVRETWHGLVKDWSSPAGGIILQEVAGGYQLRTAPEASSWVQAMSAERPSRLSQPALETLSIVAYRQPITRAEIEHVRGVDTGGVLRGLLDRRLIRIVGKKEEPGRPLMYGSTDEFLELFGLKSLAELPTLKAREELERLRQAEIDREGGEALLTQEDVAIPSPSNLLSRIWNDESALARQSQWKEEEEEALGALEDHLTSVGHLEKTILPPQTVDESKTGEGVGGGGGSVTEEG